MRQAARTGRRAFLVSCMAAWAAASGCCPCAGRSAPSSGANAESAAAGLGLVQVPEGVVYIPAPRSMNDSARAKIALFFHPPYDQGKLEELAGDQMICGPFLWSRLKDHALVSMIQGTEGRSRLYSCSARAWTCPAVLMAPAWIRNPAGPISSMIRMSLSSSTGLYTGRTKSTPGSAASR